MSKRYENSLKKKVRKVKRVDIPKTIGDHLDNLAIDLKNYSRFADAIEKNIDKLKWFGFQINDNLQQVIKILKERGIYKSIRDKERI